jgi:hypothetical protein
MSNFAGKQSSGPVKGPGLPGKPSGTRENSAPGAVPSTMGNAKSGNPNPTGSRGKQG